MSTLIKCFIVREDFSMTEPSVCSFLYENCINYNMKVVAGAGNDRTVVYTAQMSDEDATYITLTFPSLHIATIPELAEPLSM